MKFVLLVFCFVASQAVPGQLHPDEWDMFKAQHNKKYRNAVEERFRMGLYLKNKQKIEEHNKQYENGEKSYFLKMNQFGDMTHQEFKNTMNGFKQSKNKSKNSVLTYVLDKNVELPASVDWRTKGAVTPVKDQEQCGSCWAFSATGSLEGLLFINKGKLVSLSEQNLIDCSKKYGNLGCRGGSMDQAFQYIKDNKGIDTEKSYPYKAEDDNKCRFERKNIGGTDYGFVDIKQGDENGLKSAVATVGPVSVAIDASQFSFKFYSGGVYNEPECSSSDLDHGVLVVGYGNENEKDYWLVKNSWTQMWGEAGYIKMSRNQSNQCGIATNASYPVV